MLSICSLSKYIQDHTLAAPRCLLFARGKDPGGVSPVLGKD